MLDRLHVTIPWIAGVRQQELQPRAGAGGENTDARMTVPHEFLTSNKGWQCPETGTHQRGHVWGIGARRSHETAKITGLFHVISIPYRGANKINNLRLFPHNLIRHSARRQPTPRLFGAGRSTVHMSSRITFSRLSLGDTLFSGRRAAHNAIVKQAPRELHNEPDRAPLGPLTKSGPVSLSQADPPRATAATN